MASTLEGDFYLILKKKTGYMSRLVGRLCTKLPALAAGEIPVKITVELPAALFTRPQFQAKVIIPESSVMKPVIDADVLDNVRQVLEQQTGMDIRVSLVENEVSGD